MSWMERSQSSFPKRRKATFIQRAAEFWRDFFFFPVNHLQGFLEARFQNGHKVLGILPRPMDVTPVDPPRPSPSAQNEPHSWAFAGSPQASVRPSSTSKPP